MERAIDKYGRLEILQLEEMGLDYLHWAIMITEEEEEEEEKDGFLLCWVV